MDAVVPGQGAAEEEEGEAHGRTSSILVVSGRKQLVHAIKKTVSSDYLHTPAPWTRDTRRCLI